MADKPILVYTATPSEGHMSPALQIASYLISNGYDVALVTSANWQPHVEQAGAWFFPNLGLLESLRKLATSYPEAFYTPLTGKPHPRLNDRQSHHARGEVFFIDGMPSSLESIRSALMTLKKLHPTREVLLLADVCCPGALPIRLGASIPGFDKPIKSIGINVIQPFWNSVEAPPLFSGLGFDDGEEGRARNKLIASTYLSSSLPEDLQKMLTRLGVSASWDTFLQPYQNDGAYHSIYDSWFVCHNTTLQMCVPSAEFPVTNWPQHCKFAGFLPVKSLPSDLQHPPWLDEVKRNSARHAVGDLGTSRKKILFVAQGTVVTNYDILVNPTVRAFADRDDLLVIVNLCVRGAVYQLDDKPLPSNVRVIDYYPYDAVLPYADVFVTNSGYGGLTHGVNHGVPLVQTGTTEDKMDIGRRVQFSGLGVYLNPVTVEGLQAAVTKVLGEPKYRGRALELMKEAESMKALERLKDEIAALS